MKKEKEKEKENFYLFRSVSNYEIFLSQSSSNVYK